MSAKLEAGIGLEPFNYVHVIQADSVEELVAAEQAVRAHPYYAARIAALKQTSQASAPFGNTLPATGTKCDKCGALMDYKTQVSKKNGKPYSAYFCPNGSATDKHPIKFSS